MMTTTEEVPFQPPPPPPASSSSSSPKPRAGMAQAMRLKRLGSLKNIANKQQGGTTLHQGMASLAISQHTEISYYSADDDYYNSLDDDDDDGFCGDSSAASSNAGRAAFYGNNHNNNNMIGSAPPPILRRNSSRASIGSSCSAFTLGELGSIESVSSLECDDVELHGEVDDISVDKNTKKRRKSKLNQAKPNLREIYCRQQSTGSRIRLSNSFTDMGGDRLSDLDENNETTTAGVEEEDEEDSEEEEEEEPEKEHEKGSLGEKEVFELPPTPKYRKDRFHNSLRVLSNTNNDNSDENNNTDTLSGPPDLRHASSANLDYTMFPPELDLEKARKFWEELAEGVIDSEETLATTPKKSNSRLSNTSSVFELSVDDSKVTATRPRYGTATSRESLMSYDFTEVLVDEDEDEEEEVEEEEVIEEIIEEEIIEEEDDEEEEETIEEEEEEEEVIEDD